MAAKKQSTKKQSLYSQETDSSEKGFYPTVFDYLRFGESYTSLLLGIVVVIVSALLFIAFFNGRSTLPESSMQEQISATNTQDEKLAKTLPLTITPEVEVSVTPTRVPTNTPTPTMKPTVTPTMTPKPTNTPTPTAKPTVKATATLVPTKMPTSTPTPITNSNTQQPITGTSYTTMSGDSLWSIAERVYKDGYKWSEIAKANKLENPNVLYVGTKLTLPKLDTSKSVAKTETKPTPQVTMQAGKITGNTYTVQHGDQLWDIAVRAYGDGYRWSEIAKANKLAYPSTIHSGNVLTIPRK